MKSTTLCFLVQGDKVLLAMKKRGFGVGKWNGTGGKILDGEMPAHAAIREAHEEIGVDIEERDLVPRGKLIFSFKDHPDWDHPCHVFVTEKWVGDPHETEEMRPRWFPQNALPFNEMWADDPYWLSPVLGGNTIDGAFLFDKDGAVVISKRVDIVNKK